MENFDYRWVGVELAVRPASTVLYSIEPASDGGREPPAHFIGEL
jgi:hypothetical protein